MLNLEIVSGATPRIGNPVNVENGKPLGGSCWMADAVATVEEQRNRTVVRLCAAPSPPSHV